MAAKKASGKKSKAAPKRYIIWFTSEVLRDNSGWRSLDPGTTGKFKTRAAANAAIRWCIGVYYVGRPEARSRFSVRDTRGQKI